MNQETEFQRQCRTQLERIRAKLSKVSYNDLMEVDRLLSSLVRKQVEDQQRRDVARFARIARMGYVKAAASVLNPKNRKRGRKAAA